MLNQLTISELTSKLARREVSAREVVQSCLDQIARVDAKIHAFISYDSVDALAQADAADKLFSQGGSVAEHDGTGEVVVCGLASQQRSAVNISVYTKDGDALNLRSAPCMGQSYRR